VSPRALTELERELLTRVLSGDFVGGQELRAQLKQVQVSGAWAEGSPSIDLQVIGSAVPALLTLSPVPIDAAVVDEAGAPVGELLVWLKDGMLAGLEYAWYTDAAPKVLPTPDRIRLVDDSTTA
jgi:hypothetical protein